MDQLITLLTNLLNLTKVAAVTVPGLLLAGAFALMLWPHPPVDVIPIAYPHINQSGQWSALLAPMEGGRGSSNEDHSTSRNLAVACDVELARMPRLWASDEWERELRGGLIAPRDLPKERRPSGPSLAQLHTGSDESFAMAPEVQVQLLLDLEQIRLAECEDAEAELKQIQKSESDYLTLDLAALQKQRANEKGAELLRINKQIDLDHDSLSSIQGVMAEQEREQARLRRYSGLISARLADPGRLRPKLDFSAFVTLQTSHVVGFIILSIALGIIVAPLRNALFGLLSRKLFPWL
jgi:hypothetical protein